MLCWDPLRQLAAAQSITVDELVTEQLAKLVAPRPVRAFRGTTCCTPTIAPTHPASSLMCGEADDA
ncbi:hypothetical protein GCM10017744_080160 [Streptomyces antimycoticus]|uniref:Uncharacterized protein n=1 Tax=Streptomyces antimycoticus TaxID=68175 RepID=A0A4D4K5P5_9ACTN|nr:hypothetical protein SSPO_079170 [Streptomyces antimycoticus]GDY41233.1 hypothetical protein SANT12839_021150 [Streptomyces antimycoticus]